MQNTPRRKKWINETLVTEDEALAITGQLVAEFNQSVSTGKIEPFAEFEEARLTRPYMSFGSRGICKK